MMMCLIFNTFCILITHKIARYVSFSKTLLSDFEVVWVSGA